MKFWFSLLSLVFVTTAFGQNKNCVQCGTQVRGMPLDTAMLEKIAQEKPKESFDDQAENYCMRFEAITRNEVAGFTKELEKSQYPADDYFQKAGCYTKFYNSKTRSPLLHVVADAPTYRLEYPEVIYKYYTIKRKDQSLWVKAINAKNDQGETFIDYIETRIRNNYYPVAQELESARKLISFACAHGGVYSKYKDVSCP